MKYGYCLNHPKTYASNSRGLCPVCTKEKHEISAASKGIITKAEKAKIEEDLINKTTNSKEQYPVTRICASGSKKFDNTKSTNYNILVFEHLYIRQTMHRTNLKPEIRYWLLKKYLTSKRKKIKSRSEKNKAIVAQELLMFKNIWEIRPNFCEVTGKPINAFDVRCFSHVLTKGAYPRFRLYEKNIVLCLPEKHHEWEFGTRKTLELSWIETLESALKTEYYNGKTC